MSPRAEIVPLLPGAPRRIGGHHVPLISLAGSGSADAGPGRRSAELSSRCPEKRFGSVLLRFTPMTESGPIGGFRKKRRDRPRVTPRGHVDFSQIQPIYLRHTLRLSPFSVSKALLGLRTFRSAADGAIGRSGWALQELHRWFCDPDRPRQSYRPFRFLQPRARFASCVELES
jgi:hypothetical protein